MLQPRRVEFLRPVGFTSMTSPAVPDKQAIQPQSTAAPNSTVDYLIPQTCLVDEVSLSVTLPATTAGTFAPYVGFNVIDRVQLLSGAQVLQEFDLRPVLRRVLASQSSPSVVANMLAAMGPSTGLATSQTYCIPLPFMWSNLLKGMSQSSEPTLPLAVCMSKSPLRVRITFGPTTQWLAAGGTVASATASFASVLNVYSYAVPASTYSELDATSAGYRYKSIDFDTISAAADALASATDVTIDISQFAGSLAGLDFQCVTEANMTANNLLVQSMTISNLQLSVDSKKYWEFGISGDFRTSIFERWLAGEVEQASIGAGYSVSFCLDTDNQQQYSGALRTDDINKLTATLRHNNGAASQIDICAIINAVYILENGVFKREN